MANEIKLTFAGDAKPLTRAFDSVGDGALDMADDLARADKTADRFSGAVGTMNEKVGDSESKFMGAADLVDGLSSAFGISLGPTVDYARAFGDMAGGFNATLGPAMEKVTGKVMKLSWVTKIQTGAQTALNAVMRANPLFLVITALTLLTAGFVIAYKRSETFRNVVHGAMRGVQSAIGWVGDKVSWLVGKISGAAGRMKGVFSGIAETISWPYRTAFNLIASAWNNTVGRLSFSVPGWVPVLGGNGWDVPDIPTFANGGVATAGQLALVGERGPELIVPGRTSTVIPNHALGGGVTVVLGSPGDPFVEAIRKTVRVIGGGNVQRAFGTA